MKRSNFFLLSAFAAAAALGAGASAPGTASAQQVYAPAQQCHVSLYGTITSDPGGRYFTLKTLRSDVGYIHIRRDRDTIVNTNGYALRPGTFAGVYGCFTPARRAFAAEEITLAPNAQNYDGYRGRSVTLHGVVVTREAGRVLIHTAQYGYLWVSTPQRNLTVGEHVIVRGTFDPMQSSLDAAQIL